MAGRRGMDASHGTPTAAAGPWIVTLDADPGETMGVVRLAAPLSPEEAGATLSRAAVETNEIRWEGLVPRAALVRRAGRLVLTERPVRADPEKVEQSFLARLRDDGLSVLPWNTSSSRLLSRLRFYRRVTHVAADDFSDASLARSAPDWLAPHLKLTGGQLIGAGGLVTALSALARRAFPKLDERVPSALRLPTGSMREIDYDGAEPAVEARIQEVFGLSKSPEVCGVPVTFRLLSPAHRPLQVTRDLESFWRVTYAEVRKEMRGRYPKHYWPEDPLKAEATSGPHRPGHRR